MHSIANEFDGSFFTRNSNIENVSGKLTTYDDGSFELNTNKAFSNNDQVVEQNIYCKTDNYHISIIKPMYKLKTTGGIGFGCEPVRKCILFGSIIIMGDSYLDDVDDLQIKALSCNIECSKWFFNNSHSESSNYDDLAPKEVTLNYHAAKITINSAHDFKLGKRKTKICITSNELLNYNYAQEALHKVITFLSFGTKKIVRHFGHEVINQENKEFLLIYKPSFYSEKKQESDFCLFYYNTNNIQTIFCKWSTILGEVEHILRLYFLPKINKLDAVLKFITYSQVIECLHRKLTKDNKKTYLGRINDVIFDEIYGNFISKETHDGLNDLLKNTRNYYTHYNDKLKNIPDGIELFYLTLKLELLIDLFLLKNLEFTYDHFKKININVIDNKLRRKENIAKYS